MNGIAIIGIALSLIGIILMMNEKMKFFENLTEKIRPEWKKAKKAIAYLKKKRYVFLAVTGFILIAVGMRLRLIDHITEIIQLSAPTSVVLFILSRWWEERKEFKRIRDIIFNEMAQNAKIIQENLDLIRRGKEGLKEGTHAHGFPLHALNESGWTLLLASGKLTKLKGKTTGKDIISAVSAMYTQIILINKTMVARAPILFGPLRTDYMCVEGKKVSHADIELDSIDMMIEGNLLELKKKISKINKELS